MSRQSETRANRLMSDSVFDQLRANGVVHGPYRRTRPVCRNRIQRLVDALAAWLRAHR